MCKRVFSKRTNLGNIYFDKIYIIIISNKKLNVTWLTKKKGFNCGIYIYFDVINSKILLFLKESKV
jgi:hypothetical protein